MQPVTAEYLQVFEERTLMLSDAQWDKVIEAYLTDDSEYAGLMIKDIYDVAVGTFTGSGTIRDDVQALLGKMSFVLAVGDSSNKTRRGQHYVMCAVVPLMLPERLLWLYQRELR